MARLGDAIAADEGRPAGQRHRLPGLLAELDPDDADDLRAALADPAISPVSVQRQVEALYPNVRRHASSTWNKWAAEMRAGRQF